MSGGNGINSFVEKWMANANWRWASRALWRILRIGTPLAIVGALIYWIRFAPIPVTRHQVVRGEIVAEVLGTGTLEARVKTTVSPKISGRIDQVFFDQGQRVRRGQVLARLDSVELQQQVAIAQANLEAAAAAIDRLKTDKDRAIAVFDQARKNHGRTETLFGKNAASREDLERAAEAVAVAQAGLSRSEAAITEGQKLLIAAEKTLHFHQARLADTEIAAPFDGLIVERQRDPGDVVVPASAILTLISTDELWISAWVDESEMAKLAGEQPARILFRSEPDHPHEGRVVRLGRKADPESREFIVDVKAIDLPRNWAVGQRAEVYIETARKQAVILLPSNYLATRDYRPGVFLNRNGRAEWRSLQLGLRGRESVEVVEGLNVDDLAVIPIDPRITLSDGQRITP